MKNSYLFTSEAVSHGHPDKVCDQISDAVLDAYLFSDQNSKVAVETMVTKNKIIVAGEVKSTAKINIKKLIPRIVEQIGYDDKNFGFSHKSKIYNFIHEQSPELQDNSNKLMAGDQGIMFGYACKETTDYMPFVSSLANYLLFTIFYKDQYELRKDKVVYPDAKCQVTVRYENDKVVAIDTIVLSTSHSNKLAFKDLQSQLDWIVRNETETFIRCYSNNKKIEYKHMNVKINPAGEWHHFGPAADTGVTGRKIVIDAYGGCAPVGGGNMNGKDPTKVDRTAAYMARHIAKNIVHNKMADSCVIELAYIIGEDNPISVNAHCVGNKMSEEEIVEFIKAKFDLTVKGMIDYLKLKHVPYTLNCVYSHFGVNVNPEYASSRTWEKLIKFI